jgi:hypothetical protein
MSLQQVIFFSNITTGAGTRLYDFGPLPINKTLKEVNMLSNDRITPPNETLMRNLTKNFRTQLGP